MAVCYIVRIPGFGAYPPCRGYMYDVVNSLPKNGHYIRVSAPGYERDADQLVADTSTAVMAVFYGLPPSKTKRDIALICSLLEVMLPEKVEVSLQKAA